MQRATKTGAKPETYETLSARLNEARAEKEAVEEHLEKDRHAREGAEEEGVDALDAFMMSIKAGGTLDVKTRTELKHRLVMLRQQVQQLERLVNVARPATEGMEKATGGRGECRCCQRWGG